MSMFSKCVRFNGLPMRYVVLGRKTTWPPLLHSFIAERMSGESSVRRSLLLFTMQVFVRWGEVRAVMGRGERRFLKRGSWVVDAREKRKVAISNMRRFEETILRGRIAMGRRPWL